MVIKQLKRLRIVVRIDSGHRRRPCELIAREHIFGRLVRHLIIAVAVFRPMLAFNAVFEQIVIFLAAEQPIEELHRAVGIFARDRNDDIVPCFVVGSDCFLLHVAHIGVINEHLDIRARTAA